MATISSLLGGQRGYHFLGELTSGWLTSYQGNQRLGNGQAHRLLLIKPCTYELDSHMSEAGIGQAGHVQIARE